MGWIKRKVDEHVCPKPLYDPTIHAGDIWRCDNCNVRWIVKGFEHGVQWDPIIPPHVKWERYVEPVGIYAPGTK